jgi:hypothetical protein
MPKDRKPYFRWYNRHVRGRPEPKQRHRYQCVFCGFLTPNASNLEQLYDPKIRVQLGFKYLDPLTFPASQYIYKQKLIDYKKAMGYKSIRYLNLLISQGLLTQEEVVHLLGGQMIRSSYPIGTTSSQENRVPVNIPVVSKFKIGGRFND